MPPIWNGSLAVLVDRGTQGAAEILATVLRQSCGARLVGDRTFGHAGTAQSIGLSSGARLELTGGFYAGPDAEPLSKALEPDLWIRPDSASTASDAGNQPDRDEILDQAIDLLLESTLWERAGLRPSPAAAARRRSAGGGRPAPG